MHCLQKGFIWILPNSEEKTQPTPLLTFFKFERDGNPSLFEFGGSCPQNVSIEDFWTDKEAQLSRRSAFELG